MPTAPSTNPAFVENAKILAHSEELAVQTLFVTSSTIDQDVLVPNVTLEVHSYDANSTRIVEAQFHPLYNNAHPIETALQTPTAKPMLACANLLAEVHPCALPMRNAWPVFTKLLANVKTSWSSILPEN